MRPLEWPDTLAAAFVPIGQAPRRFLLLWKKSGEQESKQAISHAIGDEYFRRSWVDGHTCRMNQVAARALDNSSWRNVSIVIDIPHAHKNLARRCSRETASQRPEPNLSWAFQARKEGDSRY